MLICTTTKPVDNLEYCKLLSSKHKLGFKVLPTFRPDKALTLQSDSFIDLLDTYPWLVVFRLTYIEL
jgi:glucuronate isomerase